MADSEKSVGTKPRKAWLFAQYAGAGDPIGVEKDVADLERLFEHDLHPDYRAEVQVVRSGAGTLTTDVIMAALDDIATFEGDRVVWFGGHGVQRTLGTAFLETDDRHTGGHITIEALWRHLAQLARERDGLFLAVLDVCHGAPLAGSPLRAALESSLVGIAASQADQKARGTAAEGGWLTQRVIRALRDPRNPPADGRVTVGSLIDSIGRDQRVENRGGQTPYMSGQGAYSAEVLNRLGQQAVARPQPLEAWRQLTVHRHAQPNMLFKGDAKQARVYVELTIAQDKGGDERSPREQRAHLADTRGPRTLRALLEPAADREVARWRVLGEPGAGKSTVARRLAADLASEPGPVPVYLPLVAVARADRHPFDVAERLLAKARGEGVAAGLSEALRSAAATGRVWLLLDGLDEVDPKVAAELRQSIEGWARDLSRTPIAVLGRPFDEHPLSGFEHARVLPLDASQQRELLGLWLGETPGRQAHARISARPRMRELARNPLMLSLMALLTDAGEALGNSRTALYDRAIGLLLEQPGRYGRSTRLSDVDAARAVLAAVEDRAADVVDAVATARAP